MKAITFLIAVLVSAFLLVVAVDKVVHWDLFIIALGKNPFIPVVLAGAVGGGVIAIEVVVAGILVPPATRRTGFFLAGLLFGIFAVVTALLLWRAPSLQCGCSFSAGFDTPTLRHVIFDVLLAVLNGYLFRVGYRPSPRTTGVRPPAAPAVTPSIITDQRSAS